MARTVTTGGAISGYWAIGRIRIAARPAITMKIESTAAKIGRSMKKRDIMAVSRLLLVRRLRRGLVRRLAAGLTIRLACRFASRRAFPVGGRRAVADLHRSTGRSHHLQLHHAVHDHAVAGFQAVVDDPAVTRPVTDFHRPGLGLALGVHDIDELALGAF